MNTCPKCGAELQPGARSCRMCGMEIAAPATRTLLRPSTTTAGGLPQTGAEDAVLAQLQRSVASFYQVVGLLGRGRATAVYKAVEINPPRDVALKVLPPGLGQGPGAVIFKEEARKAMMLSHPNVVPIYRVGLRGGAPYFIAMKLVDGRGVDAFIKAQGAIPAPAVYLILRGTAEALTYAHGRGTVHGHLRPANILVDRNGRILVSDFGIARAIQDATGTGGHPRASSPDQPPAGPADPADDLYSLGMVTRQLLGGSVPRDTSMAGSAPDGLVQAVARVVQRLLARDVAQRYASAADMLAAVKAITFGDDERRDGVDVLGRLARGEPALKAAASRATAAGATAATPTLETQPTTAAPSPAEPETASARAEQAHAAAAPSRDSEVQWIQSTTSSEATPAAPAAPWRPSTPEAPEPDGERGRAGPLMRRRTSAPFAAYASSELFGGNLPEERKARRRSRLPWVIVALLIVGAAAGAAYWFLIRRPAATQVAQAPAASPAAQAPSPSPAASESAPPASAAPAPPVAESARTDTARAAPPPAPAGPAVPAAPHTQASGLLLLSVVPSTAQILLDGELSGAAGAVDSEVAAGRRHLQITAPGRIGLDTTIDVQDAVTVDLGEIVLRPTAATAAAASMGRLRLTTVPATAEILVDGREVGTGSLSDYAVEAGERLLRIAAPGYQTLDTLVAVHAGATVRLGQVILRRLPGGP